MNQITIENSGVTEYIHELDTSSSRRLSSGSFTDEVNQIPSFSFTLLPVNPCYDKLRDRQTIVSVLNTLTGETEFEGTLLHTEKSMSTSGKVQRSAICEGYLGYLCDSIQPYHHYESYNVQAFLAALLGQHNAMMPEHKRIYLGSCDIAGDNTNSKTTAYRNTLEEIKVNLIERLGGEIRIRKINGRLCLDYVTQYGSKSPTTIELAKNMYSLDVKTDTSNIVTRLIPLGAQPDPGESAQRIDISSVNGGKLYIDDEAAMAKYGVIAGTVIFDDITLPSNLIQAGREYLENNNRIKKSYSAQVLDLSVQYQNEESLLAGNTYRFKNKLMGIDEELRLIKKTVDIYKPYKPSVEIGDKAERITDIATQTAQLIEYELPKQKLDILASAKATATSLIEAGINGYVVVNENEILIMDTPDKETATRVWRWNSGGFGYSSTGYHGTYGTAITMDGAIVADFITAGVLRGLEINNGSGTFHVGTDGAVTASAMNITGGSINITTRSETYDVIQLSNNEWTMHLSPLQVKLSNSSTGCELILQAGGVFFDLSGSRIMSINNSTGNISTGGNITAAGAISASGDISSNGIISSDDYNILLQGGSARTSLSNVLYSLQQQIDQLRS